MSRTIIKSAVAGATIAFPLLLGTALPAHPEPLRVEICMNTGFCLQIINTELPDTGVSADVDASVNGTGASANVGG